MTMPRRGRTATIGPAGARRCSSVSLWAWPLWSRPVRRNRRPIQAEGRGVDNVATGAVKVAMSAVPRAARRRQSRPVSPTPSWPSGYQILDAVPGALAAQYPTSTAA